MRAAWYTKMGPAREVLQTGTLPDPQPAPGEVRVRIHASGVNPSDVKARAAPGRNSVYPRVIPHSDGAGVIDAVGDGVERSRIGSRVWVFNGQWKRAEGTAAEFICLPAGFAIPLPEASDFATGACLGIPALTAWRAVSMMGGVAGQTVLVSGGAGAVSHHAIQMARLSGAKSIFTTISSPEKAEIAKAAGADACINYRSEDVAARIRDLTDGQGVDRVIELDIAGNARFIPDVLKPGGLAAVYGSNQPTFTLPFMPMIVKNLTIACFIVYELSPEQRRQGAAYINGLLEAGRLQTRIAGRFPLEQIAEAHEAVESGTAIGNVVLDLA